MFWSYMCIRKFHILKILNNSCISEEENLGRFATKFLYRYSWLNDIELGYHIGSNEIFIVLTKDTFWFLNLILNVFQFAKFKRLIETWLSICY